MTTDQPTERHAARVLLIDTEDRVLLLRHLRWDRGFVWVPPGGAIELDESPEEAAVREVLEETTLALPALGPLVWVRRSQLPEDARLHVEHFFIARVSAGSDVATHLNVDPVEVLEISGHRWWSLDEIRAAADTVFAPRAIADLLLPILAGELPSEPIAIGL